MMKNLKFRGDADYEEEPAYQVKVYYKTFFRTEHTVAFYYPYNYSLIMLSRESKYLLSVMRLFFGVLDTEEINKVWKNLSWR